MPPIANSLPGLSDDYVSKFFLNDTVYRPSDPSNMAKVMRSWSEEEGDSTGPKPAEYYHAIDRPLRRGEIGICDIVSGGLFIVPEAQYLLFSREFMPGDVVKRSLTSVESAVVLSISSQVKLQPTLHGGITVDGWVPWDSLKRSLVVEARDRVVYDEWIGTVEEVVEDGLCYPAFGPTYNITDMGGVIELGRTPTMVMDAEDERHSHITRSYNLPTHANPDSDVIVAVNPVIIVVTWNCMNPKITISEQQHHPQPKRFWFGDEVKKLTLYESSSSTSQQLGSHVTFKTQEDEMKYTTPMSYLSTWMLAKFAGMPILKSWQVSELQSTARLRWQDGTETEESTMSIVPYRNIDDYESWPGEYIMWRGEEGVRRPAVVQKFDPRQRIAILKFMDDGSIDTVPVLEIDPGTPGLYSGYGVSIGQSVLITINNAFDIPTVPHLGDMELPIDNLEARHELAQLCEKHTNTPGGLKTVLPSPPSPETGAWWGEVIDNKLDGTAVVRLANDEVVEKGIKQLIILNDTFEHGMHVDPDWVDEDGWGDDPMYAGMQFAAPNLDRADEEGWEDIVGIGMVASDVQRFQNEMDDGRVEQMSLTSTTSWETYSDGLSVVANMDVGGGVQINSGAGADDMDVDEMDARDDEEVDRLIGNEDGRDDAPSSPVAAKSPVNGEDGEIPLSTPGAGPSCGGARNGKQAEIGWERFEVLEDAPAEHMYFDQPVQAGGNMYMKRLRKEHNALSSSLPDNILVRTYENRLDLMRVLIFGPEGTPYNDAPFVFDVYLDPTKFPNEPPTVHFHSHTNKMGRCNPNLYEEGKVCLSILGTWQGDKSESWDSQNSSLLQVFVSISGLVLVRSPYHCEPAFAKLEGTREGRINSRLYSEKAYVLSRSFVRTALTRPPASLETEVRLFYLQNGRLKSVIDHAKRLIDKSQAEVEARRAAGRENEEDDAEYKEMWNADAMGSLTQGAIISLKRTITALEKIWSEYEASLTLTHNVGESPDVER